jgi:L-lysine 2,3-aminomutase
MPGSIASNVVDSGCTKIGDTVTADDVGFMMDRYGYLKESRDLIAAENLLPTRLLSRLHATYPQCSGLLERQPFLFNDGPHFAGLDGFRRVVRILDQHGIRIGHLTERELFAEVYRFKATRHALNAINWSDYQRDSMFQLVFPQPGMIHKAVVDAYAAASPEQRRRIVEDYVRQTNPHDGHQLLNKPWIERDDGGVDIVEGSQHKYPQCQLIFDQSTQECFAFCTYCFRHAQVRGDEDMFIQRDIEQVHEYVRRHKEITDLLITGGDAGYIPAERLRQYVMPIIEDPRLLHVRTIRLGSRMLTYQPERILTRRYDEMLDLFDTMHNNGVQLTWMAHFSTPRELLNPSTIAAIRRLQNHGVVIRSQSPIMNHISLFTDENGRVDVDRSAQNWIDLGNLLATLLIRFHSLYCARATGEHHYFTAPLADIDKVFSRIMRSLASINRPSRYITMTTSAGKLSILGKTVVNGETLFALKFNESRNMEWMDRVFLAKYNETESRVDFLVPFDTEKFFFEEELKEIETALTVVHGKQQASGCCHDQQAL